MSLLHCTVSQTLSGRAQWTCLGAFALGLAFIAEVASANGPQCNTRSGFVANQPEENPLNAAAEEVESTQPVARVASPSEPRQKETIPVHLSQLEGLLGFPGRYTNGVPVLGLRLENYPAFDPLKNCNRVAVVMVKPRIDPIGPSRWRASVEDGRFAIEFGEELDNRALVQDPDASNRFFWVFPGKFGRKDLSGAPWNLTQAYDAAFRREAAGSPKRRWIAEAYLSLALRTYRMRQLVADFPEGGTPLRTELHQRLSALTSNGCANGDKHLICAATDLIEMNEAASIGTGLSPDAFRTGDALLQNSGISTGLRQLDFASTNVQAAQVGPKLSPTLFATKRTRGYLRPIRLWEVETLHAWYNTTGRQANLELSRQASKDLLLQSHVDFISGAVNDWKKRIDKRYPLWTEAERVFLTLVSIDMENVTGFSLVLPSDAAAPCEVLQHSSKAGRSNWSVTKSQARRVKNAATITSKRFAAVSGLSCLAA